MLINDTTKDFKMLCIQNGVTQKSVAEKANIGVNYLSQIVAREHIDKQYVKLVEALGYDIRIEYIPKK